LKEEDLHSQLPDWFSLIQTDREYYENRYRDIENGQSKLNIRCFLSAIIGNYWFLFYRKYAFVTIFIMGIFIYFLDNLTNFICFTILNVMFVFNKIELQNTFVITFLITILLKIYIFYYVFKKYDRWYLSFIEERYNKGYTIKEFKDTSPFLKYFAWIGTAVSFVAPFYLMKAYPKLSLYYAFKNLPFSLIKECPNIPLDEDFMTLTNAHLSDVIEFWNWAFLIQGFFVTISLVFLLLIYGVERIKKNY
jgi:hypothetical protein